MKKIKKEIKKICPIIAEIELKKPLSHVLSKFPKLKKHSEKYELSYRIFLLCCLLGQVNEIPLCGPGDVIDELWHEHILHSEIYHYHCNKIFGSYLHHHPDPPSLEKKEGPSALVEIIKILSTKGYPWLKDIIPIIKLFDDRSFVTCSHRIS